MDGSVSRLACHLTSDHCCKWLREAYDRSHPISENGFRRKRRRVVVHGRIAVLTNAVAFIDRQSLPLLIDQIKSDLQVTDTQMSYLVGLAFVLTYVGLGIPAGMLIDRFPRRTVMSIGIALWSAATLLCGLVVSYRVMFLARIGIGAGETVVGPGSISLIRDAFPEDRRNRAIGIWAMGANVGGAAALLGGGAILAMIGDATSVTVPILGTIRSWQLVLICCAFITLPIAVLLFTFPEPARTGTAQFGSGLRDTFRYMGARWRVFVPLFVVNGLTIIMLVGHGLWVPAMFGRVWHLSRPEIGLTLGIMTLVFRCEQPVLGRRRHGLAAQAWRTQSDPNVRRHHRRALAFMPGVFAHLRIDRECAGQVRAHVLGVVRGGERLLEEAGAELREQPRVAELGAAHGRVPVQAAVPSFRLMRYCIRPLRLT